jgi:ribonuclease P/MRP protein subunit POP5
LKGLPPALRRKKRYVAFKIITDMDDLNNIEMKITHTLWQEIWQSILSLYGEWYGNAGIRIEYFDEKSMEGIVKCCRDKLESVIVALTLISRIGNMNVAVKTLGVSGTIKGCRKFLSPRVKK